MSRKAEEKKRLLRLWAQFTEDSRRSEANSNPLDTKEYLSIKF
jgi:hypothetical protein